VARTAKKIKHDGFRILAELGPSGVKLITRKGFDLAERFPLAVAAIAALPARSCSSVWWRRARAAKYANGVKTLEGDQ